MSRRSKDRIYVPDLDKELVERLRLKLHNELFQDLKEKIEIGPQTQASGKSIGTLTVVYKSPSKKIYAIHINHAEQATFRIEIRTGYFKLQDQIEFKEIRNYIRSLIEFLKKI